MQHYLSVDQQNQLLEKLQASGAGNIIERLALDQLVYLSKARERQERFFAIEKNRLEKNAKQQAYMREKMKRVVHAKDELTGRTHCGRAIFANTKLGAPDCKTCIKSMRDK
jgi:hypothetical protein